MNHITSKIRYFENVRHDRTGQTAVIEIEITPEKNGEYFSITYSHLPREKSHGDCWPSDSYSLGHDWDDALTTARGWLDLLKHAHDIVPWS